MMRCLILAAVIGLVYSDEAHKIGEKASANHMCWTVDQIIDEAIRLADKNTDGILQHDELMEELLINWHLGNIDGVSFHDFTQAWMASFHDHHDTAHSFFKNLDLDGNNKLTLDDVMVHINQFDKNPQDGLVQEAEFRAFIHAVHPDSHQNGGHGHGC